jgi:hypothetical protein
LVLVVWYGRVVLGSVSRDSAGMRVGWFVSGGVEGLFLWDGAAEAEASFLVGFKGGGEEEGV